MESSIPELASVLTKKRWCIALLLLMVCNSAPGFAQRSELVVRGHVVRQTMNGPVPMPRSRVTLHRIGQGESGPVDSILTDRTGEFVFSVSADSASMYLATARHSGIAYFAPPSRLGDANGESEIVVFDTTSGPLAVRVSGRHLVVSAPNARGDREVVEVYEIQNDTLATLVASPQKPTFRARIPDRALNPRANQGDFTGSSVRFSPGAVDVLAPIAPGVRQLVLAYDLAARDFPMELGLDDSASVFEILLEESTGRVEGGSLDSRGPVTVEGRVFQRFTGRDIPAGMSFSIMVPTRAASAVPVWFPGLILGLLSLGGVLWMARRRPRPVALAAAPVAGGPGAWNADQLREALAGVDTALASRGINDAARPALLEYREELHAALERELAGGPRAT